MGVFDRQIATALRLIAKNGAPCSWTKETVTNDVSEPWIVDDTDPESFTASLVFLPVDREGFETLRAMRETEIPGGHSLAYMGAVEFVPALNDIVTRTSDGEKFRVVFVDKIAPNGDVIVYRMLLAS